MTEKPDVTLTLTNKNVLFDDLWKPWLEDYGFSFWGTF